MQERAAQGPLARPALSKPLGARALRRRAGLCLAVAGGAGKSSARGESAKNAAHALGREPSSDSVGSTGLGRRQRAGEPAQGGAPGSGKLVASVGIVGGLALLAGGSLLLKDQIRGFLVGGCMIACMRQTERTWQRLRRAAATRPGRSLPRA